MINAMKCLLVLCSVALVNAVGFSQVTPPGDPPPPPPPVKWKITTPNQDGLLYEFGGTTNSLVVTGTCPVTPVFKGLKLEGPNGVVSIIKLDPTATSFQKSMRPGAAWPTIPEGANPHDYKVTLGLYVQTVIIDENGNPIVQSEDVIKPALSDVGYEEFDDCDRTFKIDNY